MKIKTTNENKELLSGMASMAYLQMMVYCYWSQKRVLMIAPCTMSHFGVYKLPVAFVCV